MTIGILCKCSLRIGHDNGQFIGPSMPIFIGNDKFWKNYDIIKHIFISILFYVIPSLYYTKSLGYKSNSIMDILYTISYWILVLAHTGIGLAGLFGVRYIIWNGHYKEHWYIP